MSRVSLPPANQQIVDGNGRATAVFRRFMEAIWKRTGGFSDLVDAAVSGATASQATADQAASIAALSGSYPVSVTITGDNAGQVVISTHFRLYPDRTVTVTGGAVAAAFGSTFYVYYDQQSRQGGAVTYALASSRDAAFASEAHPYRHYVGVVVMPASGGSADTTGVPAAGPGFTAT